MERKKTTASQSPSSSFMDAFRDERDRWRSNEKSRPEPTFKLDLLEGEMPHLDQNDVYFYQYQIEGAIRRNIPDSMNSRYLYMLRVLAAQARRSRGE